MLGKKSYEYFPDKRKREVNTQNYQNLDDIHVFNTHFWEKLTKRHDPKVTLKHVIQNFETDYYPRVKRWTSKKGINLFDKNIVVIPMNENQHWFLCVGK